jgi:hypothetical protein
VPLTQVKLSINEIDSEIIVFDGGNESTPPIRPPDDIRWRSIPIRHLHIEDELRGNIGLSFQKIEGVSPFIRLPRQISLRSVDYQEFMRQCKSAKNYDVLLCLVVTANVCSLISARK